MDHSEEAILVENCMVFRQYFIQPNKHTKKKKKYST
jgi:hypothetical protein